MGYRPCQDDLVFTKDWSLMSFQEDPLYLFSYIRLVIEYFQEDCYDTVTFKVEEESKDSLTGLVTIEDAQFQ